MRVKIRLEEIEVYATLLVSEAPETCAAFLRGLPFDGQATHGKWSGPSIHMQMPLSLPPEKTAYPFQIEHPMASQAAGDITYLPPTCQLGIHYGEARWRWITGLLAVTLFGRLEGNLTRFAELAKRLQREGSKRLLISPP